MTVEPLQPDDLADPDHATLYVSPPAPHVEPGSQEWALIRYVGDPIGEVIPVPRERMILGRAPECDLCLPGADVSRHHAALEPRVEAEGCAGVFVTDLGSTNGTYINGHRMEVVREPRPLNPGDVLRVGGHAFKLKHLDPVERHYHEVMLAQTTLDSLTGVSNRATVLSFLEKHSDLAHRHGRPLSVILCDLDLFKEINDKWGHAAGDEVLRFFGELLLGRLRASDQAGRIGGEEFLLVLPETAGAEATLVAETLRQNLELARIAVEASPQPLGVTCCFGVAQLAERDANGGSLLARADVALYRAKAAGRNRVDYDRLP